MFILEKCFFIIAFFLSYIDILCDNVSKDDNAELIDKLLDDKEIRDIFGDEDDFSFLNEKSKKNRFYFTNIGYGFSNNFVDVWHGVKNFSHNHFMCFYKKEKQLIKTSLENLCKGVDVVGKYDKDYSGFYEYFNFVQSFRSTSFYINPTWNFQIKNTGLFLNVGVFVQLDTHKYVYTFLFNHEKEKKEEDKKESTKNEDIHTEGKVIKEEENFEKIKTHTFMSFNTCSVGISFGIFWGKNKINPLASWNISLFISFGLQFGYNNLCDFCFYKWHTGDDYYYLKFEYDFYDKKGIPNTIYIKKDGINLNPTYLSLFFKVGHNKFSIWVSISTSPFLSHNKLSFGVIPDSYENKIEKDKYYPMYKNSCVNFKCKENDDDYGKVDIGAILSHINFSIGISYVF